MKNSSEYPKEVQECIEKVNEWIAENTMEYDCDLVCIKDTGCLGWIEEPAEYILCSNYEDGFSSIIFKPGKGWFHRGYMSEQPDTSLTHNEPWNELIGIMAG